MKASITEKTAEVICCCQVNAGSWAQESYETASRMAGRRARQLRKLGYKASCSAMGPQITSVGSVILTLLTIQPGEHRDTFGIPQVRLERI